MKKIIESIKNGYNKHHVLYNTLLSMVGIILVISITFGLICHYADYTVSLKFNDEEIKFFSGETLYFDSDVTLDFYGDGYIFKLDGKKIKTNTKLESGTYKLKISKLLRSYTVDIDIDYEPSMEVFDLDGNVIHNYLSNDKSFTIKNNTSKDLRVNFEKYIDQVYTEEGDYNITVGEDSYTVNIVSY